MRTSPWAVKGGRYTVRNGSWYLHTEHGEEAVSNPFKVAWDAGMQIREVIQRELHRKVYVVVVVVFPDMEEPDPGIEVWVANERVRVLWGSHDLVDRLVEMVSDEDIYSPPTGAQIEEEIAVLRPGLVAETKVGGAADDVPAPAPTTIDLTNRQPVIGHANVVNVYNGPVTIYQGSASGERPPVAVDVRQRVVQSRCRPAMPASNAGRLHLYPILG